MPIPFNRRTLLTAAGALPLTVLGTKLPWDDTWDVIVVGSGAAGLSAAIAAREAGASVLVIEKMTGIGGNSALCTGDMAVCGSPVQKTLGFTDTPDLMADDICREGKTSDRNRALFIARGSRGAWEWTRSIGMDWDEKALQSDVGQSVPRGIMMRPRTGATLIAAAMNRVAALKIEVRCHTPMVEILRNVNGVAEGLVVGKDTPFPQKPRAFQRLKARRGIVLAFGGFGADALFRSRLDPRLGSWVPTTNQPGATGESVTVAATAGCALTGMSAIQSLPFLCAEEIGMGSAWGFIEYATASRGIWVDDRGQRFVNETTDLKTRADIMLSALARGHRLYGIIDSRGFAAPISNYLGTRNWEESEARGLIHAFPTLETLAADYDIPANGLRKTIQEFNTSVRHGEKAAFDRETTGLTELREAPWYLIEIQPKVHHTMGGITICPAGEVLDRHGRVIPKLFAAGEATGGLFGEMRIPSHSITDALVTGLSAGRLAARIS